MSLNYLNFKKKLYIFETREGGARSTTRFHRFNPRKRVVDPPPPCIKNVQKKSFYFK